MIKNILSVGDSFTYGEELKNIYNAWPYQVGKILNADVVNLAKPAASNDKILRLTLDYLLRNNNVDLVLIGWSNPGRMEFSDELGYYDVWPGYTVDSHLSNNFHWRKNMIEYVSQYHNPQALHLKFIQQIILLQSYLESKKIKYVMMNIMQNDYYKKLYFDGIKQYHDQINTDNFLDFNISGMIEWTKNCKQGSRGHFLEDGHTLVAGKVLNYVNQQCWALTP